MSINDTILISIISTLLYRKPGKNIMVDAEMMDTICKLAPEFIYGINYSEGIDNYIYAWYSGKLNKQESLPYLYEINKVGDWLYLMVKYFNYVYSSSPKNYIVECIKETDRKFMNMKKILQLC